MPDGFKIGGKEVVPVDLKDAGPEKQSLYGKLDAMSGGLKDEENTILENPAPPVEFSRETPGPVITEDDKKEFLRSVMAGSQYVKVYTLFGSMKATFTDRSVGITEKIFKHLNSEVPEGDREVQLERLLLASQLTFFGDLKLNVSPSKIEEVTANLEQIMALKKPLYQALMQAGRDFEEHVALLTNKAQDPDFWKPGGAGSSSMPAGPGR